MSSYYIYLLAESRSDYILKNKDNIDKIYNVLSKNIDIEEKDKEQAVRKFLEDLESNKSISKYLNWVVKQYINGKWIYPEDVSRIETDLDKFYRSLSLLKKENKETDLNKYDMASFNKLILDLPETKRQEDIQVKDNEAEKVYEDDDFIIIHPLTQEAAILYGKGTKWCTAATGSDNWFDNYNKKGPLYILISKKDPSEKYQFHFESGSFMDKFDKSININDFIKKYPKIKKYFASNIDKNNYKNWIWFDSIKLDYNICLEAVKKNGDALQYIPDKFIDYNLCLEAVEDEGENLRYVPKNLIDYNICLEAVKSNSWALQYVPKNLINYNLCLEAVKNSGFVLQYVPEKLKTLEICLEAVKKDGFALKYVPEKFKDYNFCLEAVKKESLALRYVPKNIIDYNMCLEAVKKNGDALFDVPKNLKNYNLCLKAVEDEGENLRYVPENLKDYNMCLEAVKNNCNAFEFVPENLKDYNFCLEAVKGFASSCFPKNRIEYNEYLKDALEYAPDKFKERIKQELNI